MQKRPAALSALLLAFLLSCSPASASPAPHLTQAQSGSLIESPTRSAQSAKANVLGTAVAVRVAGVRPLPLEVDFDYQLGGATPPAGNVGIVVRDRKASPAGGRYNICYLNGFQTQPDDRAFWKRHPSLILQKGGKPVRDSAWNEWLLDIRTAAKRASLIRIIGPWITKCANDGYAAVEFDNLDSYTRSKDLITKAQAIAFARRLVNAAHSVGLAAGQKNLPGYDGRGIGYDFAIGEECGRWKECASYLSHYGRQVLLVEYRTVDFDWTCQRYASRLAIVQRDLSLSVTGIRKWC